MALPQFYERISRWGVKRYVPAVKVGAQVFYKMSTVRVSTTSDTPVDDAESLLSFSLTYDSNVIIIYNASSKHGSTEYYYGKYGEINVDGVDKSESRGDQSTYVSNYANSFTCIWAGSLAAGSHTVKGRFASNYAGQTVGIDQRQIIVIAIPKDYAGVVGGVMSTVRVTTTSASLVDDPEAVYSPSLPADMETITLYQASSKHGSTEYYYGKYGTVNVDGVDESGARGDQSPFSSNCANSFTSLHSELLKAGTHTVKGRFASNYAGSTVGIDQRGLGFIAVPAEFSVFKAASTVRVSTTSSTLVDDSEASLSFTLAKDSLVIIIYNASSKHGSTEYYYGKYGEINVDGVDKSESRGDQSTYVSNYANSFTCIWAGSLAAGSHTVKGRFASNYAGQTVGIDQRELVVLAIPTDYLL
jgi:hypothetical protein